MIQTLPRLCLVLVAAAAISCGDEASVNVKYAQGFTPHPATVSVLGIFRDGRMSVDAWGPLGPVLTTALGAPVSCDPAFGEPLLRKDADLYALIDDDTRQNGITEDLLTKLAPRAEGDLILTVTVHGSVANPNARPNDTSQPSPGNAPPVPRGGLGGPGKGNRGQHHEGAPRMAAQKALELSASLYSIRLQKPVARLSMSYTGTSIEEAVRRFGTEVGTMMPGSTCRGWSFLDEKRPAAGPPPATVIPSTEGP
jgi:hypothetical protein